MNSDVIRRKLDDHDFMRLFVCVSVINGDNVSFKRDFIEKKMYKYADDFRYQFLFNDIDIDHNERKVMLGNAIDYCYSFGILSKECSIKTHGLLSKMNITRNNAKEIMGNYDDIEIKAMNDLCDDYYNGDKKVKVLIKK